jgi:hypothetical protein
MQKCAAQAGDRLHTGASHTLCGLFTATEVAAALPDGPAEHAAAVSTAAVWSKLWHPGGALPTADV